MRRLVPLVALLAEACGAPRMPTPKLAAHPTSALHEVPYPPPPARVESIPERPNDASVWVDGEWVWQGGRWSWRRGRWVVPAPDTAFAPWTHVRDARGILYVVEMRIQLQQARDQLLALAREHGAGDDPVLRQQVAELNIQTEVFRMTCQRILDKLLRMGMPGPEASIIKLHWTDITQSMPLLGMKILGPQGLLYDAPEPRAGRVDPSQWLQRSYLASRAASIAGVTSSSIPSLRVIPSKVFSVLNTPTS